MEELIKELIEGCLRAHGHASDTDIEEALHSDNVEQAIRLLSCLTSDQALDDAIEFTQFALEW